MALLRYCRSAGRLRRPANAALRRHLNVGQNIRELDHEVDRTVYVGNLNFKTTDETIKKMFSEHGSVETVRLPIDREIDRPRGFAFVTLQSKEEAASVRSALQGVKLDGRVLKVNGVHEKRNGGPLTFQRARRWVNTSDGGSNAAKDHSLSYSSLFEGRRVAVFGIPAPFTGICTDVHVPPYLELASEFKGKVDELVCMTVSDPFCLGAWVDSMGAAESGITFLADTTGSISKHLDVYRSFHQDALGMRCMRFSMIVNDGTVEAFSEVKDAAIDAQWLLVKASRGPSSQAA